MQFYTSSGHSELTTVNAHVHATGIAAMASDTAHGHPPLDEAGTASATRGGVHLVNDLRDRVTVIVTTSPIPSNPSYALLQATIKSFALCSNNALSQCRIIVACDGYTVAGDCVGPDASEKKGRGKRKAKYKWGSVLQAGAEAYTEFIHGVKQAAQNAAFLPCSRVEVMVLPSHHGFAGAVKEAAKQATTEFVLIVQHDWLFQAPGFDVSVALESMALDTRLKYVGAQSLSTGLWLLGTHMVGLCVRVCVRVCVCGARPVIKARA